MRSYKGRGVVLHTLKYGDSSMVAHLLTDTMGRQSYMVQGIRSSRGRGSKAALFQPLFAVEYEGLYPSRGGDLHRFKELSSGIPLRRTPFDIRRSAVALFCAEVIYRLIREGEPNEALFEFVWCSVEALDSIEDGVAVANFHLWFLANLSRHLGFMPHGEWSEGMSFDIMSGEYTLLRPTHGLLIEPMESSLLSRLLVCDVTRLGEISLSRERRAELLESLLRYYGYHLDVVHSVQSLRILRELF